MEAIILNTHQIQQKVIRIAHQIAEFNYDEPEIIMVGIADGGFALAKAIFTELQQVFNIPVSLYRLSMEKANPVHGEISLDVDLNTLEGKSVILVDDVLESGKTITYAAKFLLNVELKKLASAVLVDRMHPKFPIKADFVGLTLSTTVQNHIEYRGTPENAEVILH